MTAHSPRIIYSVRWDKTAGCWRILIGQRKTEYTATHKWIAIADGRVMARERAGVDRTVTQLRVFNLDGTISFEATYPRSSDPVRTPG